MADGTAQRINQIAYNAQQDRQMAAVSMMQGLSAIGGRAGRRLGQSGLEVSVSGDGLSAVVQPGVAVVRHATSTGGDYVVVIPAQVTKTLAAKPSTGQKRRDSVVIDVLDADVGQKATALREANINVTTGTATSGTPAAPAEGTMQLELGQIAFDGTNTPTVNPTNPRYTWAAGGVGKVYSQAERDALAAYDGLKVYRADLARFQERVSGAWRDEPFAADTGWLTNVFTMYPANWTNSGTRVRKVGNRVRVEADATREGATIGPGDFANSSILNLNASYRPSPGLGGASDFQVAVGNGSGGQVSFGLDPATGDLQAWSADNAIATGDRVRVVVEYYTD